MDAFKKLCQPIVSSKARQCDLRCADERKIDHDSIGLAKAETMTAPRPPLPVQLHSVPSAAKSHTAPE